MCLFEETVGLAYAHHVSGATELAGETAAFAFLYQYYSYEQNRYHYNKGYYYDVHVL